MTAKLFMTDEQWNSMLQREESYRFSLETDKRHEKLFAPLGISFQIYRTLIYLLMHDEGAAPSQIADDLMISRQSMTNVLDQLEKKALVERLLDSKDRRRLIVKILPDGETLAIKAFEEEQKLGQLMRKYISKEELDAYHYMEKRVYEAKVAALNDILAARKD